MNQAALSFFRKLKDESYTDTAYVLRRSLDDKGYGYGSEYTERMAFACKFSPRAAPDAIPGTNVALVEADLFFGNDVPIASKDRVRVTHLYGEALPMPLDFNIVSGPTQTPLGREAGLESVTT